MMTSTFPIRRNASSLGAAIVAASLAGGAAAAADLPRQAAPPPVFASAPAFTWTGFYAGLNAGYGFGGFTGPSANEFRDPSGFVGGGQVGYNYQINQWVIGAETDIQFADLTGRATGAAVPGSRANFDYLGTVRARAGYAIDRFLPYITAGLAYGGSEVRVPGIGNSTQTHIGWTAGGGVEYAITNNITAKLEGLYVGLEDQRVVAGTRRLGLDSGIVRAGVNYKF